MRDVLTGLLLSHLEDGMSICSGTGLVLKETLQGLFKPLDAAYHGIIVASIQSSIFSVGVHVKSLGINLASINIFTLKAFLQ